MGCLIDMKVSKNRTASVTAFIEPMGGSCPPPPSSPTNPTPFIGFKKFVGHSTQQKK